MNWTAELVDIATRHAAATGRGFGGRVTRDGTVVRAGYSDGLPPPTEAELRAWVPPPAPLVFADGRSFLMRFTPEERAAIRADADPTTQDLRDQLLGTGELRTNDPAVTSGMDWLVYRGHITPARRAEILGLS